jgi:hypothetical protein
VGLRNGRTQTGSVAERMENGCISQFSPENQALFTKLHIDDRILQPRCQRVGLLVARIKGRLLIVDIAHHHWGR